MDFRAVRGEESVQERPGLPPSGTRVEFKESSVPSCLQSEAAQSGKCCEKEPPPSHEPGNADVSFSSAGALLIEHAAQPGASSADISAAQR